MNQTPEISVGILTRPSITITFDTHYTERDGARLVPGVYEAFVDAGRLIVKGQDQSFDFLRQAIFMPVDSESGFFTLHDVTIGVGFHWQRDEDQSFKGSLKMLAENDAVVGINLLSVEDYLTSVISSEMSATSSLQLLKAHAVISRSWLLAQIQKNKSLNQGDYHSFFQDEYSRTRWYDREDHNDFDVCADDHCQRYQGITRASTPIVTQAVSETNGQILAYNGIICDARFYKCCGGATELFENCWEPIHHPYLLKVVDNDVFPAGYPTNLTKEEAARQWIMGSPAAYCNTSDKNVLSQVLNDYDQETNDFYRWKVVYTQKELSELIQRRSGIDFGTIQALEPVERGVSGRITKLRIVGEKRTMIFGKELEIRKTLSESHLYSSAFVVDKQKEGDEVIFVLHGAGWGHGVGLCQIGAAMMGSQGFDYQHILAHYYPGAVLDKRY